MEAFESNHRGIIFNLIKEKFSVYALWTRIESDIALMCSNIPEVTKDKDKLKIIDSLLKLKDYLVEKGVDLKDLMFLDEEIERYEKTSQISLYNETEEELDPEIIKNFARMSHTQTGVIGIPYVLNYKQLKLLTNGVYEKTRLIKFYISRERMISGKITGEIYEHPQKIPIATLVEIKKRNIDESGFDIVRKIILFGEKINQSNSKIIKEIEIPFRVYRFISEDSQEFILMSTTQLNAGDCIVIGVVTQIDDYKLLTDSARLPTKLPYLFVQEVKERIIRFNDHAEFRKRLAELEITKRELFDYPFTVPINNELKILLHPEWFKWMMWAWMVSTRIGLINKYPLHLMIVGEKHSGKSALLNCIYMKSREIRDIFSGSSSTLKSLVPSFKYNPAKLGYLAESNRFAFCDEFLRCIANTRTTSDGSYREESVATMNDLLEHQKREAGSGVSQARPNMTARVIATTNPIKGINCMEDLINYLDGSFLSRWLIYFQNKEHYAPIRKSKDKELKTLKYKMSIDNFISIIDYLNTFNSEYDDNKLDEILNSVPEMLSENLRKHYDSRHRHHIECLMDGIVKTRCLFERDMSFKAKEEDYEKLKEIWFKVISSWIDSDHIKKLPVEFRKYYIPENAQYLFNQLCSEKRPLGRIEFEEIALKAMDKNTYRDMHILLRDLDLIIEDNGFVKPFYMKDGNTN